MNSSALPVLVSDDPEMRRTVSSDWMSIEAAVSRGESFEGRDPLMLLNWNATLPSGTKFVVDSASSIRVRADFPRYIETADTDEVDQEVGSDLGVVQALQMWNEPNSRAELQSVPVGDAVSDQLTAAANDCGWEVNRRDEMLVANLEVLGGFMQAQIFSMATNGCFAFVEIISLDGLSETARHAIAHMLLRAGAGIRWVRPALRTVREKVVAVFEITLGVNPNEIADCLSVLSIAGRLTADEAKALADENFASDYLETVSPILMSTVRN